MNICWADGCIVLVVTTTEMDALEVALEIAQGGDGDPDLGGTIDSLIKDFAEAKDD